MEGLRGMCTACRPRTLGPRTSTLPMYVRVQSQTQPDTQLSCLVRRKCTALRCATDWLTGWVYCLHALCALISMHRRWCYCIRGWLVGHGQPGTLSLSTDTLLRVIMDIGASGAKKVYSRPFCLHFVSLGRRTREIVLQDRLRANATKRVGVLRCFARSGAGRGEEARDRQRPRRQRPLAERRGAEAARGAWAACGGLSLPIPGVTCRDGRLGRG